MWLSREIDRKHRGFTLVEVLVTLVILGILASVALPYAEIGVRREKEIELRRSLRLIRTAIDNYHRDWQAGRLGAFAGVSRDGYPESFDELTRGIELADGGFRKYLRRIPRDPFADAEIPVEEHWRLIGYRDTADSKTVSPSDIYDVRSRSDEQALDGSHYRDW